MPAVSSETAGLFSPKEISQIAASQYWKLLLHWQRPLIGSERSESDSPDFFLSPDGRLDPEKELIADLKAFLNPDSPGVGPIKQHPQCAFPERFRFLKEKLNIKVEAKICDDFKKWKSGFNPKSVTLVYAAPYFGSPASMFGHTFLRVDSHPRPGHSEKNDLLDYGISFEADTGANPGIAYALKGLLGFYHGLFLQQPYYMKINSYVNMESRDLWEYELNLSSDQIDRMLNHTWEMGITYFNYYFFNKNCSYQLLSLLEVANPDWNLRSHFTAMTIPGDTIRILNGEAHAIRKIHLRPALMRILENRLSNMSAQEEDRFFEVRNDHDKLSADEKIKTLDALLDWDKLRAMKDLKAIYDPEQNVDKKLLAARARAASREKEEPDTTSEVSNSSYPPEQGHDSSKISVFAGNERSLTLAGIEYRPVFQDILDPDEGYLPHSSLVVARTRGSYLFSSFNSNQNYFRLDDFTAAEVINLVPITRLQPELSWRVGGGLFHPDDVDCVNCLGLDLNAGGGFGFQFLEKPEIFFYSLLRPHVEVSNGFTLNYGGVSRFGLSLENGVLLKFSKDFKTFLSFEPYAYSAFTGLPIATFSKGTFTLSRAFLPFELRFNGEIFLLTNQNYFRGIVSVGKYF